MAEWIGEAEAQRRIREEANRIADERIGRMADKDGERLAVLEANYSHMDKKIDAMARQVDEMHELLLKAKGARWVILAVAGAAGFISAKLTTLAALLGFRVMP
jgi:hypothetical protein